MFVHVGLNIKSWKVSFNIPQIPSLSRYIDWLMALKLVLSNEKRIIEEYKDHSYGAPAELQNNSTVSMHMHSAGIVLLLYSVWIFWGWCRLGRWVATTSPNQKWRIHRVPIQSTGSHKRRICYRRFHCRIRPGWSIFIWKYGLNNLGIWREWSIVFWNISW